MTKTTTTPYPKLSALIESLYSNPTTTIHQAPKLFSNSNLHHLNLLLLVSQDPGNTMSHYHATYYYEWSKVSMGNWLRDLRKHHLISYEKDPLCRSNKLSHITPKALELLEQLEADLN